MAWYPAPRGKSNRLPETEVKTAPKGRPPYGRLDPLKGSPQAKLPAPQPVVFHEISRLVRRYFHERTYQISGGIELEIDGRLDLQ